MKKAFDVKTARVNRFLQIKQKNFFLDAEASTLFCFSLVCMLGNLVLLDFGLFSMF
jgi:hypothetical protein